MKPLWLLLAVLLLFSGCRAQPLPGMELNRRLIIEAIGIDADKTGVTLTLTAIDPDAGETKTEGNQQWTRYVYTAGSVSEAVSLAEQSTGKVPFFAYARILLFGRQTAANGIRPHLDYFLRNRTVRNTISVCVGTMKAEKILTAADASSVSPAKTIEQMLQTEAKTGQCVSAPFFQFVNGMLSQDTEAFCPLIDVQKSAGDKQDVFSCAETAVFSGDRFHFTLSRSDTAALLIAKNAVKELQIRIPVGNDTFDCRLQRIRSSIKTDSAALVLSVFARAAVIQTDGNQNPPAADEDLRLAQQAIKEKLLTDLSACFHKLYAANGADLLRLQKRTGGAYTVAAGKPDVKIEIKISTLA